MPSSILRIASSAVSSMRTALAVHSQNVANAETPGYIRQRANLVALSNASVARGVTVGNGVTVEEIQRLRNACVEAQINHQEGQLGQQQAQAESLARLQATFGDLNGSGLNDALGSFFDAVETLQTNPGSIAARSEVVFAADTFAARTRQTASHLTGELDTLSGDLERNVAQINSLLHEVAELNAKIMPLQGSSAGNELRVAREQAIRQLANLCGASGLDQDSGSQDVLVGGVRLVEGSRVTELTLTADPADPAKRLLTAGAIAVGDDIGGRLAGGQDTMNQIGQWQQALDDLAATFADAVNTLHRGGYDPRGNAGGDVFTYDANSAAASLKVRPELADDPELLAVASTAEGGPGDVGNAQAIMALRQQKLMAGGTTTVEDSYRQFLSSVGQQASRAGEAQTARQELVDTLDTRYAEEAGVSLDDEAVEIMRYQQVFNASTKLVKMADEMMQEILALTN